MLIQLINTLTRLGIGSENDDQLHSYKRSFHSQIEGHANLDSSRSLILLKNHHSHPILRQMDTELTIVVRSNSSNSSRECSVNDKSMASIRVITR
jgi:hypothetical protein